MGNFNLVFGERKAFARLENVVPLPPPHLLHLALILQRVCMDTNTGNSGFAVQWKIN